MYQITRQTLQTEIGHHWQTKACTFTFVQYLYTLEVFLLYNQALSNINQTSSQYCRRQSKDTDQCNNILVIALRRLDLMQCSKIHHEHLVPWNLFFGETFIIQHLHSGDKNREKTSLCQEERLFLGSYTCF